MQFCNFSKIKSLRLNWMKLSESIITVLRSPARAKLIRVRVEQRAKLHRDGPAGHQLGEGAPLSRPSLRPENCDSDPHRDGHRRQRGAQAWLYPQRREGEQFRARQR